MSRLAPCRDETDNWWRAQKYVGAAKKPTGTVGIFLSDSSIPAYVNSSEMVQFTNNAPSDRPEAILPTTANLVEVPESYSSLAVISLR